jgi:hypothetical protein
MKNTWLKFLVAISAIMIAGSAAYFSVTGLGVLFSGAAVAVMVMAGSLEFAKLVTATYLKQEWENVSVVNKWYLTSAVVILMAITSAGIFGYLSNAFQQQNLKLEQVQREIDVWDNKIKLTNDQIVTLQGQQKDLSSTQSTLISKGNVNSRLIRSADNRDKQSTKISAKINTLQDSIVAYNGHINDIKNANISIEREVGGFRFVAEAFNVELKSVVKFFIILIVVVFDPLAVALVISFNQLMIGGRRKDEEEVKPTADPEDLKNFVDETVRLRLSDEELKILENALLNPQPPNEELTKAAEEYKKRGELLADMMQKDQELGLYDEPFDNPMVKEKPQEKWDGITQEVWDRMEAIEKQREAIHGPITEEDLPPTGAYANSGYRERLDAALDEANEEEISTIEPTEEEENQNFSTIEPIQENIFQEDEYVPSLSDEEIMEMNQDEYERNLDMDEEFEEAIKAELNSVAPFGERFDIELVDGGEFEIDATKIEQEIVEDETISFVDDTYTQHEIVEEFDGFVPEPFATPEEVERFNIDIKIIDNSPEFDFNIEAVTPTPEFDVEVKVVEPENQDDEKKNF